MMIAVVSLVAAVVLSLLGILVAVVSLLVATVLGVLVAVASLVVAVVSLMGVLVVGLFPVKKNNCTETTRLYTLHSEVCSVNLVQSQ